MKYFLIFALLIFIGCKSIPEIDLWIVGKWQIIDSEIYPVKIGSFELKENSKLDFKKDGNLFLYDEDNKPIKLFFGKLKYRIDGDSLEYIEYDMLIRNGLKKMSDTLLMNTTMIPYSNLTKETFEKYRYKGYNFKLIKVK